MKRTAQLKRQPLKRKASPRPMTPEEMSDLIEAVERRDGRCILNDDCNGTTEAHHVVPQRKLKKERPDLLTSPLMSVALCQRHHARVEHHNIYLNRGDLPIEVQQAIGDEGFGPWWDGEVLRRCS